MTNKMAKRRSGERDDGGRTEKRRRRQQHLYILVDDWDWGYSVRKIDLPIADSESDPEQFARLPPAVFRFEARPNQLRMAAVGTRIIHWPGLSTATQVTSFDVRLRSLAVVPPQPEFRGGPVLIPVGDRLFFLSTYSFQVLDDVQSSSPFWEEPPVPPVAADHYLVSSAVHPDGKTIFVSVKPTGGGLANDSTLATYAFDTAAPRGSSGARWTKLGDWPLPFTGRAHFDSDLYAWVGVAGDTDFTRHICAPATWCPRLLLPSRRTAAAGSSCRARRGRWAAAAVPKMEDLFSAVPNETHVGACLVPRGGGRRAGKFCLVESVDVGVQGRRASSGTLSGNFKLRLVTFSLEYDKNGDLTTRNTRRVRHYRCPEAGYSLFNPAAFWL